MDLGVALIGATTFFALLFAWLIPQEVHMDFWNAQGNLGQDSIYWFNLNNREASQKQPPLDGYPYVRFSTNAVSGSEGAILVEELITATWFDSVSDAMKVLIEKTKSGRFGSVGVYAVELQ